MKKVVISCGPIPARLDSVKFITNRFKGGLAFKTAKMLYQTCEIDLTVVKWTHTPCDWDFENNPTLHLVNVEDVVEYAQWFEDHAREYDAFIMAAAVANLMPSNPYEGKFPSHNYRVGERFDIPFEIAPRAIDIIKRKNPRCCLIGYKLFDAATDAELVDIARHTLEDAKANVVFANTPKDAKKRKIALMPDGAVIPMDFDGHVEFMKQAIFAEYFQTRMDGNMVDCPALRKAVALVEAFEDTFPGHGTVAFRVPGIGMATTSRGHRGKPVIVTGVDFENRIVYTDGGKATLNAPLLWEMLVKNPGADYVIHRHFDDPRAASPGNVRKTATPCSYEFPGTMGEVDAYRKAFARNMCSCLQIAYHGYVDVMKFEDIDWRMYYSLFPGRYFKTRRAIEEVMDHAAAHPELETLEVGGNSTCRLKWNLDPNMEGENVIGYDGLEGHMFDVIVARNSINYLSGNELAKVMAHLKPGGTFIANSFASRPGIKMRDGDGCRELAVSCFDDSLGAYMVDHFLFIGDTILSHSFYGRDAQDYRALGFDVEQDGSSIIIQNRQDPGTDG